MKGCAPMLPDVDIEALRIMVKDALDLAETGRAPAGSRLLLAGYQQAEQSASAGGVDRAALAYLWRRVHVHYDGLFGPSSVGP